MVFSTARGCCGSPQLEVPRPHGPLQGGFEIRTFIAVSGATEGSTGELWFYAPIPIFAVGCTVAVMRL